MLQDLCLAIKNEMKRWQCNRQPLFFTHPAVLISLLSISVACRHLWFHVARTASCCSAADRGAAGGKRYFRSIIVVISRTLCSTNGGTCWTVRAHSGRSLLPLTKASCCCCLLVRVLTLCIYSVFVMRLKLAFTVNPILTFSDTSTYLKSSMHQANTDQEAPFYLQDACYWAIYMLLDIEHLIYLT